MLILFKPHHLSRIIILNISKARSNTIVKNQNNHNSNTQILSTFTQSQAL